MIVTIAEARTYLGLASSISEADEGLLNMVIAGAHAAVRKFLQYDPEYKESRTEFYPRLQEYTDARMATLESDGERAYIDRISAGAGDILIVQHLPVRQVRALYVDENARHGTMSGAFAESTRLSEGVDFYPEYEQSGVCKSGIIRRVSGSWPATPGTVKITYECGYTAEELNGDADVFDARELKEGVLLAITRAFKARKLEQKSTLAGWTAGPMTSESLGDYSYSVDGSSVKFFNASAYLTPETKEKLQEFRHYGMIAL